MKYLIILSLLIVACGSSTLSPPIPTDPNHDGSVSIPDGAQMVIIRVDSQIIWFTLPAREIRSTGKIKVNFEYINFPEPDFSAKYL